MTVRSQDPPRRPLLEEIGNAVTHGTGSLFSIAALCLMLRGAVGWRDVTAAWIYFGGMFLMFTMSCLYHSFRYGTRVKRLFRRFDYSSIYLQIGATFAPILLSYVGGAFGTVFFFVQWTVIALGITLVGVFGPARLRRIHIPLYLILGWCGLLFIPRMFGRGDADFFFWILGGGVLYSLGVIPFVLKRGPSHFIWHFFVLAGAVTQWIGVYLNVYHV